MGVAPERMRYDGAYLIIRVASLNEAYSRASELLEPRRRSHTGNVFEKALWLVDHAPPAKVPIEPWHNRPLVRLKHLREAVEIGAWPTLPVVDETPVTTER
jgi:hypothetical protein